jgi:predicted RNA-binding Zn ribbon-like protein
MANTPSSTASRPSVHLADHPALALLNTVFMADGELVDSLQSSADVLQWLALAGQPTEPQVKRPPASLLATTRTLREIIRAAVERRKAGKTIDLKSLNAFLAQSRSHLEIFSAKGGALKLERRWQSRTPEEILAPLAEAAAELLTAGDFNLIRRCEDRECVLWFYDRTRSHHRRWCSMATCGNRNKVAAFRERQQQGVVQEQHSVRRQQ